MSRSLSNTVQSKEVRTLDGVRLSPAKAQWQSPTESTRVHGDLLSRLSKTVESALIAVHGSQKAAAIEIGCDQSQMRRQVNLGTFDNRQHAAAGAAYLARLGRELIAEFGDAEQDPRDLALQQILGMMPLIVGALTTKEQR